MPNIGNLSDTTANAEAAAISPLFNSGTIQIFSGPQPATANTALGVSNILLVTLTFSATAFGAPSAGSITANAIGGGTAINTGTATFARIYQSNGTTVVCDTPVATAGGGINLTTVSIVSGAPVSLAQLIYSVTET